MLVKRIISYTKRLIGNIWRRNCHLVWKRATPVDLLIWDGVGQEIVLALFSPDSYRVLDTRTPQIFLDPSILWKTIKRSRFRRGAQFESVIEVCKPRHVATFIDNNEMFHKLSKRFPDIDFIAIQNGSRFPHYDDEDLPLGSERRSESTYLCFGSNEIDSYNRLGYRFKEIVAVGSIKNFLFLKDIEGQKEQESKLFDIAFISQFRVSISDPNPLQVLAEHEQVARMLSSYLLSNPKTTFSVILVNQESQLGYEAETKFYTSIFGDHAHLIPASPEWMASYAVTEKADLIISSSSTLAIECLARGLKVLICSLPLTDKYSSTEKVPDFVLSSFDFQTFTDAVARLRKISRRQFIECNGDWIDYLIHRGDPTPVLETILSTSPRSSK